MSNSVVIVNVMILRKDKFGSSSEKTKKECEGQLSLFNEAEVETNADVVEPISIDVKGHTRAVNKKTREELLKDLPIREFPCYVAEDERTCDQCGTLLKESFGKKAIRSVKTSDAKLFLI